MTSGAPPACQVRDVDAAFVAWAAHAPEAIALIDGDRAITYAALADEIALAARALARLDIKRGDRLAVVATKRVETVVALFAALRLGAIGTPLNPLLKPDQLRHILVDSGACALVAPRTTLEMLGPVLDAHCPHLLHRVTIENALVSTADLPTGAASESAPEPDRSRAAGDDRVPDDTLAMILYTSGSTARPKGVVLTRSNLAHGAASVATYLDIGPDDRLLALMPLSFDYGLNQVLTALATGARAVLFDYLLPKGVVTAVVGHRITGLPAVPHIWNQLARLDWPPVPHLRYLTTTGGRMPVETTRMLERKLPDTAIVLMYGFTEAFRSTWLPPTELARRPDSIGQAVPHSTVLVVDGKGRECAPGEVGELIHGGPLVAAGYWRDEAATRAKFRPRFPAVAETSATDAYDESIPVSGGDGNENDDGKGTVSESFPHRAPVATRAERFAWSGDLARRDEDGFLYFVSRHEDLAKLHGYRVNPAEIEEAIARSPLVVEVAVVCVPHPVLGQAAIAVVITDEDDVGAIRRHGRDALPRFMQPERYIIVKELPTNPNGKVDRRALAARYGEVQ